MYISLSIYLTDASGGSWNFGVGVGGGGQGHNLCSVQYEMAWVWDV